MWDRTYLEETDHLSTATQPIEAFEHIRLADIDDTAKPLPENVYTLEVNKLESVYRKITKADSEYAGQEVLVLKGSYTIVDDEKFSGRKLWQDFWTPFKFAQIALKKQMNATGVLQGEGESLVDYAKQFGLLNPPARFQVPVALVPDRRDPDGPLKNEIKFFGARAA